MMKSLVSRWSPCILFLYQFFFNFFMNDDRPVILTLIICQVFKFKKLLKSKQKKSVINVSINNCCMMYLLLY